MLFNVKLRYKLPPEERTIYRENEEEVAAFIEQDSEDVPVGEAVRWAVDTTPEVAARLAAAENLEYIEPAVIDEALEESAEEAAGAIVQGVDVDALNIHNIPRSGGQGVWTLVCDTGCRRRYWAGARLEQIWTWYSDDGLDRHGHGEFCTNTAATPGGRLVSAKTLSDEGRGANTYTIAAGDRFARLCRERGARGVISLSLGSNQGSRAYRDAVNAWTRAGIVVLAAAGNQSRRDGISFPAAYCTSVGAMDRQRRAAGFSNRNQDHSLPDIYALGVSVNGHPRAMSGTSMATPVVARAAGIALGAGAQVNRRVLREHNGAGRVLDAARLMPAPPRDTLYRVRVTETGQVAAYRDAEKAREHRNRLRRLGVKVAVRPPLNS